MLKKTLLLILIGSGIFFYCGCSTLSDSEKSTLESQSNLKFSDIPVPMGFKAMPEDSYSFQCSGVRMGVLKYRGKSNADQLIAFYKEQMPMYNWSLVNIIEYGQRILNFDRETENCIINIQPKGSSSILTISVGPKSQNLTKRQKVQKTLDK